MARRIILVYFAVYLRVDICITGAIHAGRPRPLEEAAFIPNKVDGFEEFAFRGWGGWRGGLLGGLLLSLWLPARLAWRGLSAARRPVYHPVVGQFGAIG